MQHKRYISSHCDLKVR